MHSAMNNLENTLQQPLNEQGIQSSTLNAANTD